MDSTPLPAVLQTRTSGETILVVDDEAFIRDIARTALQTCGYRVLLAADGLEAVEVFRREHEQIRLVVLDLVMPRMSGGEALVEMLAIDPEVRVLISTGFADQPFEPPQRDRIVGLMRKPYRPSELVQTVRALLVPVMVADANEAGEE
jgi:two-component system, cell cycle sensor histidine kinase and response regulator CckA